MVKYIVTMIDDHYWTFVAASYLDGYAQFMTESNRTVNIPYTSIKFWEEVRE